MTTHWGYLHLAFAQHALIAASIVAVISGVVGPFVITRGMSFAVHGAAELALTGAAAGLLIANDAVSGALVGSVVVAGAFGVLAVRERERDSAIGVVLGLGLGLGFYLLHFYHGFETEALDILVGQITSVGTTQIEILVAVALAVLVAMIALYRPLTFASVDLDLAEARGVRTRLVGLLFLLLLCVTVTEAAQVVGTVLVLSLVITPAAAAQRLSAHPGVVIGLSTVFALIAADGGLLVNIVYVPDVRASSFITFIAFAIYALARIAAATRHSLGGRGELPADPEHSDATADVTDGAVG
ncbi:MAG TPA: metal ABC transporter permease [Mycobacteriales bacterium]|nr:metal ABC transporter permease [Mycobacteriales bacterium]